MRFTPAASPTAAQPVGGTRQVDFNPVTRVAGGLAVSAVVDHDRREVVDSHAKATLFRGYENVLQGRDPRDAIFVSSRACGACGSSHAAASASALEMALDIQAPPMAIAARNMLLGLECLYSLAHHLFVLAGPDYSEPVVRATNPELWERAQETLAAGANTHGYATISEIMTALTRVSGQLYAEALHMARVAREGYVLVGGKFPHPQTTTPGGISSTIDTSDMNVIMLRVTPFFDYSRKAVAVWNDLTDFFYEANPRYREVGARPANMIDLGHWDDPWAYDATYEGATRWGESRWATPGALVDGRIATTDLHRLHTGFEEYVDHSFYDDWSRGDEAMANDPLGNRLSPNHPWNKATLPSPAAPNTNGKYSWSTAARWDRQAMECGSYARLWITAVANKSPHRLFCEPTGQGMRLSIPQAALPATELEWNVPQSWGAFERNRARAYSFVHSALVTYDMVLVCLDLLRKDEGRISTPYQIPRGSSIGVGLGGSPRGLVSHHIAIDGGAIEDYQILTHGTFTASPRDSSGQPGPMEEAVTGTPLLSSPSSESYVDVMRAIRSFDPCMACAAH
ncbi:MAG: nickel-dependent hydrogenase large subunit [Thermoleophilaceae bacterium]